MKQLGLMRLEGQRMKSDVIETFKIVNRKNNILILVYFSKPEEDGRRRHDQKLFKKRFSVDIRSYTFSRVIDNWICCLPVA